MSKIFKKRSCSSCRTSGHNRRSCPELLSVELATKNGKRSTIHADKKNVLVHNVPNAPRSTHIVDLASEKKPAWWQDINVYEEKSKAPEAIRTAVDFAAMVRKANEKVVEKPNQKIADQPVAVTIKKKEKVHRFAALVAKQKGVLAGMRINITNAYYSFLSFGRALRSSSVLRARSFASIALVILIIGSLPFPAIGYYQQLKNTNAQVVAQSTDGFLALQSSTVSALSANIPQAESDLNQALASFGAAQSILDKDHQVLLYVTSLLPIIGTQVSSRQHLLEAGQHLALGNTYMVKGVHETSDMKEAPLTDRFALLRTYVRSAVPQYTEALSDLEQVDSKAIPVEYQQAFHDFKLLFGTFIHDMNQLTELIDTVNVVFGDHTLKRYLVVFQNNYELRPTGGFMGSYALIDVQKGQIMNIDVPGGGTYDLQGQLNSYVAPPTPLQLVDKRWEFQDANWFADFPASAQKIEWFYQHARSRTVDGVIAINASVLERLLKVMGPIKDDRFGLLLDHENALSTLQDQVENKYDKTENKPKAVLAELLNQFLASSSNVGAMDAVRLLTEMHDALQQKEIQVYMNDTRVEQILKGYGWTGEIAPIKPEQDYLNVVHTNISGQKSDARIEQTIAHQAVIALDGSITDTVVVRRTHTGSSTEEFYGAPNISYVRVYVPEGAELIDAGGFSYPPEDQFRVPESWYTKDTDLTAIEKNERFHVGTGTRVTDEFGKTVFGNWVITKAGETSEIYFTYRLPFSAFAAQTKAAPTWKDSVWKNSAPQTSSYQLEIQKQSGVNSTFSSDIIYPSEWSPIWQSSDSVSLAKNGAQVHTTLSTDMAVGVMMEKNK